MTRPGAGPRSDRTSSFVVRRWSVLGCGYAAEAFRFAHEGDAEETGWTPRGVLSVGGALKYREYYFFKRSLMKHVAANAGEDTDTTRDWDDTNWQQVDAFADQIWEAVAPVAAGH